MSQSKPPVTTSSRQDIDAFIDQLQRAPAVVTTEDAGRLVFALDATASRQPTWDHACHLQSEMFRAAADIGGLQVQLCYFRGFGDFYHSDWLSNTNTLLKQMNGVQCMAGHTQIERLLNHALFETRLRKVQAIIYIGDCVEESVDKICQQAGELGLLGTPVFVFQEGNELVAKRCFKQIARLSGGAYSSFGSHSAKILHDLLAAVAIYAAGGRKALEDFARRKQGEVLKLTHQLFDS
ncbi:hypothetical protein [Marinobacterium jannaschii]|uniref:hypothetical protein n=1 Tax=Marinobacterium jannaschii TaxID=64970 RepID=UPI0004823FC0|nr:hypothetical protein [Marinobacterium jannaschii]